MPVLNRIRLVCKDGERDCIHIKSTLAHTSKLDSTTDIDVAFTDTDLVAIKNITEQPRVVTLEAIRLPDGRQAIFSPSRSAHFKLLDPEVSSVHCARTYPLGGGETLMLRSSEWAGRAGGGAAFPV